MFTLRLVSILKAEMMSWTERMHGLLNVQGEMANRRARAPLTKLNPRINTSFIPRNETIGKKTSCYHMYRGGNQTFVKAEQR